MNYTRQFTHYPRAKRSSQFDRSGRTSYWIPLHTHLGNISRVVESSRSLLGAFDEDGHALVEKETWDRAIQFLMRYARQVWEQFGVKIDAPAVLPGPQQSIDLHWKESSYEMLINFSRDAREAATYYGDDNQGNVIEGRIGAMQNRGLLLWLARK